MIATHVLEGIVGEAEAAINETLEMNRRVVLICQLLGLAARKLRRANPDELSWVYLPSDKERTLQVFSDGTIKVRGVRMERWIASDWDTATNLAPHLLRFIKGEAAATEQEDV